MEATRNAAKWHGLYKAAGASAFVYIALAATPLALLIAFPQPPLTGGAAILEYIASFRAVYLIELVSFVGLSLPALVVFLALYPALKSLHAGFAALGAMIGVASETMALTLGSSPPSLHGGLLYLVEDVQAQGRKYSLRIESGGNLIARSSYRPAQLLQATTRLKCSTTQVLSAYSSPRPIAPGAACQ